MTNFTAAIKKFICAFLGFHDFKCVCCGNDSFDDSGFCSDCKRKLEYNNGKICIKCGKPVGENDYCGCGKRELHFDKARSALIYEGLARKAVLSFKFDGMTYIAEAFAKLLADTAAKENLDYDTVTFVPMTKKDLRERGYNQTRLLAEKFCVILNLPKPLETLTKNKQTEKQEKLDYKKRTTNLKGAFSAADKTAVKGKNILLIDDVLTSGATASECARVLKKNGAAKVYALTVATRKGNILLD